MKRQNGKVVGSALLAIGIFIGIDFPVVSHLLAPAALPALFVVATFSLIPLIEFRYSHIWRISRVTILTIGWQQLTLPLLVLIFGFAFEFVNYLLLFVLITATASSLFAAPAIVNLLELDDRQAVQGMILSTLFTPVSLYLSLTIFYGAYAMLNYSFFLERIAIFLLIPAVIFYVIKTILDRCTHHARVTFGKASHWIVIVALIVFGLGIMDPVTYQIREDPRQFLIYLATATGAGLGMYLLTTFIFHDAGRMKSHTAGILCGFRNIGLSYGLVGGMVGEEFAVYVGVAMIPTFVAPFLMNLLTPRHGDSLAPAPESTR